MKNHRAIVITRIIFIISVLYSYNASASPLYNAINSLISLFDEIIIKQYQFDQRGEPFFSDSALKDSVRLLRLYHASLLARQQPGVVSSKRTYTTRIKQRNLRCMPGGSANPNAQMLATLLSASDGVAYYSSDGSGGLLSDAVCVDFSETDELEDEEINEKAKQHLSEMFGSLENDKVFLTTCTNFKLKSDYEITIDLIRTALH